MGIAIDILVILFLLWSLVRGWRFGLLYQVGYLALMVLAYFAARLLAGVLDAPLAKAFDMAPILAGTIAFFGVLAILLVLGSILVRRITKDLVPDKSALSGPNRVLGALVSGAKGALIAWVVLVFLVQLQRVTRTIQMPIESSFSLRFASDHNFLARGRAGALAKIVWLVGTNDMQKLALDPRVAKLLANPKAAPLMSPEVLVAINKQDYVALLQNQALWNFLDDEQVQEDLEAIPW